MTLHSRWKLSQELIVEIISFAEKLKNTAKNFFLNIAMWRSWATVLRCLRDDVFSRFDSTPACDRQTDRHTDRHTDRDTDGQTQGHSIYRASIVSCSKNKKIVKLFRLPAACAVQAPPYSARWQNRSFPCFSFLKKLNETHATRHDLAIYSFSRHVTSLFRQLYCLNAAQRIDFKLAIFVYKCLYGDKLHLAVNSEVLPRATSSSLIVRCTRLSTVDDRVFRLLALIPVLLKLRPGTLPEIETETEF